MDAHATSSLLLLLLLLFLLQLVFLSIKRAEQGKEMKPLDAHSRMSLGFNNRFTAANFLVFFALPLTGISETASFSRNHSP